MAWELRPAPRPVNNPYTYEEPRVRYDLDLADVVNTITKEFLEDAERRIFNTDWVRDWAKIQAMIYGTDNEGHLKKLQEW